MHPDAIVITGFQCIDEALEVITSWIREHDWQMDVTNAHALEDFILITQGVLVTFRR